MLLEGYQKIFESELPAAIERFGEKSVLRDACSYSLLSGGKRIRPLIVLMTADALGHGLSVIPAALSVEFFHTASLIADDLPCMDDDDERRSRPSLHKAVGEAAALLASYTLIAEGYEGIRRNGESMRKNPRFSGQADQACLLCLEAATRCGGIRGATGGQFFDLFPPDASWDTLQKVIEQKTATLFEVSFCFGWLFGGGQIDCLAQLKKCAFHLGMAFQIADDLDDDGQDAPGAMNASVLLGRKEALFRLDQELELFQKSLKGLGLWTESFQELYGGLYSRRSLLSAFFG